MENDTVECLADREADGISVRLWLHKTSDGSFKTTVSVEDVRNPEKLVIDAPTDKCYDVFKHPFAYIKEG